MGANESKVSIPSSSTTTTTPSPGNHNLPITTEFHITNEIDGFRIPCKLWKPSSSSSSSASNTPSSSPPPPRAVILLIHGGIFSLGTKNSDSQMAITLTQNPLNCIVLTTSFRHGGGTGEDNEQDNNKDNESNNKNNNNINNNNIGTYENQKSISDLISCLNYLHMTYKTSNYPLGIVGCSSGGWYALQLCNTKIGGKCIQFCIPICPVLDPYARAIYLKHCIENTTPLSNGKDLYLVKHTPEQAQFILTQQLLYFHSFKQMAILSSNNGTTTSTSTDDKSFTSSSVDDDDDDDKTLVLTTNIENNIHQIPTLIILGCMDKNVPYQVVQKVIAYRSSTKTIIIGNNAGHEICSIPPSISSNQSFIIDLDRFITDTTVGNSSSSTTTTTTNNHNWKQNQQKTPWKPWCS